MKRSQWISFLICLAVWTVNAKEETSLAAGCDDESCLKQAGKLNRDGIGQWKKIKFHKSTDALEEKISVHFDTIKFAKLMNLLIPQGWRIKFDIPDEQIDRFLVFHAETTRRRAIYNLLSRLGLDGSFYQHSRILLISNASNADRP